jgi:hypothetical protein
MVAEPAEKLCRMLSLLGGAVAIARHAEYGRPHMGKQPAGLPEVENLPRGATESVNLSLSRHCEPPEGRRCRNEREWSIMRSFFHRRPRAIVESGYPWPPAD